MPRATAIGKTNIGEDRQLLGLPVDKSKITWSCSVGLVFFKQFQIKILVEIYLRLLMATVNQRTHFLEEMPTVKWKNNSKYDNVKFRLQTTPILNFPSNDLKAGRGGWEGGVVVSETTRENAGWCRQRRPGRGRSTRQFCWMASSGPGSQKPNWKTEGGLSLICSAFEAFFIFPLLSPVLGNNLEFLKIWNIWSTTENLKEIGYKRWRVKPIGKWYQAKLIFAACKRMRCNLFQALPYTSKV